MKKIPREYVFFILLGIIGFVLFGYGLITYFGSKTGGDDVVLPNSDSTFTEKQSEISPIVKTIKVDVEGAVVKSGVFTLPFDSRIQDALILAGGFSENADRTFVEQHINLAAKLSDGAKIYIPRVSEVQFSNAARLGEQVPLGDQKSQASNSQDMNASGLININSASEENLDSLPGIGQVTAEKIISGRPYTDTQDLVTQKIVSRKEFDKIKDLITLY